MHDQFLIDRSIVFQRTSKRSINQRRGGWAFSKSRGLLSYRGGHSDVIIIRRAAAIVDRSARSRLVF